MTKNKGSFLVFLSVIFISIEAFSQEDFFKLWPDSTITKANSAKDVDYMNREEQQAVFYTNLVRLNPPLFAETFLIDYLKANGIKKDKEIKALINELEKTSRMAQLQASEKLTSLARRHAKDMGETGRTGHNSSDGKSYAQRMDEFESNFNAINENCNYGNESGVDAVIDLLIDRKVPNAGHRKNILTPEMTHIGVAIEPHRRWRYNMVQDFGMKK
ncbi:MAG: CAP domain-containing protein [Salibacteraceae bacterium]